MRHVRLASFASSLFLCGFAGLATSCGSSTTFDSPSDQTPNAVLQGENNFAKLISIASQAQAKKMPWAGFWWPFGEDGTTEALNLYESATGRRGAVDWEMANHGSGLGSSILPWWGHCNGWSAASVLFPEPQKEIVRNGVTFGIGDQKALLSEISMEVNADFFGNRVTDPNDTSSPAFMDVYPDQFLILLTNLMPRGLPIIIDRYTGDQVWNQPLAGYMIDPVSPSDASEPAPSAPNVYRVAVTMTVWWASDEVEPDHITEPFNFDDGASYGHRTLHGEIWLDSPAVFDTSGTLISSGNIILTHSGTVAVGGSWQNWDLPLVNSHPDYVWVPLNIVKPTGIANPKLNPGQIAHFVEANI
ncbi:MAG: hypothetical protein P4M08_03595 [Oligoflexia bacterium]|nr:hypothetical protein [Oligoflexia bacterium]